MRLFFPLLFFWFELDSREMVKIESHMHGENGDGRGRGMEGSSSTTTRPSLGLAPRPPSQRLRGLLPHAGGPFHAARYIKSRPQQQTTCTKVRGSTCPPSLF